MAQPFELVRRSIPLENSTPPAGMRARNFVYLVHTNCKVMRTNRACEPFARDL
jgi:hypothetical protein